MPVNDSEPRYRFLDDTGTLRAAMYFDDSGATDQVKIAFDDGTEVVVAEK